MVNLKVLRGTFKEANLQEVDRAKTCEERVERDRSNAGLH